ncbi:MAG TPA: choice-of-anchor D domain-containing protein [Terriglobales bacterium]|nr:choice-of-anchor D domain-containing protein [Terriglobales bacterium]
MAVCLVITGAASAQDQATQSPKAAGPVHIVRMTVPGMKNAAPPPATPHLNYYGGPVVSNIQIVAVFWGSSVDATVQGQIGGFYQTVTASPYYDLVSEYSTNTGSNQSIGRGSYVGSFTITPSVCATAPCTVSDSQIQTELLSQITAGHLPTPTADSQGNENTEYMIYFPPLVTITGNGGSCVAGGFCAYHGATSNTFDSRNIAYGVFPDFGPTSGCHTGCGGSTQFNNMTSVSSHEMVETATDIQVSLAQVFGPPLAWYDPNNGEIGDICNAQQGTVTVGGSTYTIQKQWSNAANACVALGLHPSFTVSAPASATAGTSFSLTVTAKNPVGGTTDKSFVGTAHFTSSDSQAMLPADFTFSPADQGTQTFSATLKTSGSQTIMATETINGAITGNAAITVGGGGIGPLTFTPTSLTFVKEALGVTSAAKKVTLTNNAGATVNFSSIAISGNNAGDFSKTTTCGATLAIGKSCTVSVKFTAGLIGAESANLAVTDNASNSPQVISLSGTGGPQVTVSPTSEKFLATAVGTTSTAKTVTVKNHLKTTLTISGISFTGTNPGDFAESATTCGGTLAAGAACTVSVTFTPTATGARSAVLNISDSATVGSPQTVPLSGSGK